MMNNARKKSVVPSSRIERGKSLRRNRSFWFKDDANWKICLGLWVSIHEIDLIRCPAIEHVKKALLKNLALLRFKVHTVNNFKKVNSFTRMGARQRLMFCFTFLFYKQFKF